MSVADVKWTLQENGSRQGCKMVFGSVGAAGSQSLALPAPKPYLALPTLPSSAAQTSLLLGR